MAFFKLFSEELTAEKEQLNKETLWIFFIKIDIPFEVKKTELFMESMPSEGSSELSM